MASQVAPFHAPVPARISAIAADLQEFAFEELNDHREMSLLHINAVKDAWVEEEHRTAVRRAAKPLLDHLEGRQVGVGMTWLMAHEVAFHNDWPQGQDSCFLVWHVAGPEKSCDFPTLGRGVITRPGDAIMFDPALPHGLRIAGAAGQAFVNLDKVHEAPKAPADVTIFLSLDLRWTPSLEKLLGVVAHKGWAGKAPAEIVELTGAWS